MKTKLFHLSLLLIPFLPAFGYTFGTNRTSVSTEIFGYDRARLPKAGNALRTDAFVTITNDVTDRVFRLYDLRVIGYDAEKGSAGKFWFYVMVKQKDGSVVPAKDEKGRELAFYWYDTLKPLRAPGWYDCNGFTRWENLEFLPGQAFNVQGGGLVLETNGLVLDTEARIAVPANTSVSLGNCWAKPINLCDLRIEGNGTNNISGGITLQTLSNNLNRASVYYWNNVTNNATVYNYRAPGWYAGTGAETKYTHESGVTFDMGEAFWIQGYQSTSDGVAVDTEMVYPKLELNESSGEK